MPSTPEHVLWAIERACPLRNAKDWADPEQTERELRPLRAYADAILDGRVFDGICVEPSTADLGETGEPLGFPVAEIFDAFGEIDFLKTTCGRCPANLPKGNRRSWAGCYDWFDARDLKPRVNRIIAELIADGRGNELSRFESVRFQQGFYSLWTHDVWRSETLSQAADFFNRLADDRSGDDVTVSRFSSGLRAADEQGFAMRVRLVPRGELAGNSWTVAPHCPNCRAEWPRHTPRCMACAFQGGAVPARKRHARGKRPFVPLARVLGKKNVGDFLRRYDQRELPEDRRPR